jgi:hypothetical protein
MIIQEVLLQTKFQQIDQIIKMYYGKLKWLNNWELKFNIIKHLVKILLNNHLKKMAIKSFL